MNCIALYSSEVSVLSVVRFYKYLNYFLYLFCANEITLSKAARKEKEFVLHGEETCNHKHSSKGNNTDA